MHLLWEVFRYNHRFLRVFVGNFKTAHGPCESSVASTLSTQVAAKATTEQRHFNKLTHDASEDDDDDDDDEETGFNGDDDDDDDDTEHGGRWWVKEAASWDIFWELSVHDEVHKRNREGSSSQWIAFNVSQLLERKSETQHKKHRHTHLND